MSFPQLGYPQYLSASQAVYGSERPGVLAPSSRGGSTEIGGSPSATAAAVTSVLGMYANPYAHNYSAFLPYTSADLALFTQMVRIHVFLQTVFEERGGGGREKSFNIITQRQIVGLVARAPFQLQSSSRKRINYVLNEQGK